MAKQIPLSGWPEAVCVSDEEAAAREHAGSRARAAAT